MGKFRAISMEVVAPKKNFSRGGRRPNRGILINFHKRLWRIEAPKCRGMETKSLLNISVKCKLYVMLIKEVNKKYSWETKPLENNCSNKDVSMVWHLNQHFHIQMKGEM